MSLLERSLAGALLILAAAALRMLARDRLPKRTFVVLWWVAAVRLLVPAELPSRFSVYALLAARRQAPAPIPRGTGALVQVIPGAGLPETLPTVPETIPAAPAVSVWTALWFAGMLALAAWFAVSYIRCQRRFRMSLPVETGYAAAWARRYPRIAVRESDQIAAPLTYGFLHPVILLPKGMDWEDETALNHILTHEQIHIRRLDGVTKLVLAAALCVHWFNPAVWLLYVLANRDLELACDEAVVRRLGQPAAYARTLLKMEERKAECRPLYSHFSRTAIEERIKAIMKLKKTTALALVCALLLVAGVTTAFATSAPDAQPAGTPLERLEDSIVCGDGAVSFTIPEADVSWSIRIGGRLETPDGGMSVHYLEEESAAGSWERGRTYRFELADGPYDSLILTAAADGAEKDIDLTAYLPEENAGISEKAAAEWEEILADYVPFGLTYRFDDPDHDGNGLSMSYQGREVRGILDGETWITEHAGNSAYGEDAVELYAVYENGRLTGLRVADEEEQAQWDRRREEAASAQSMIWPMEGDPVRLTASFGGERMVPDLSGVQGDVEDSAELPHRLYTHTGIDFGGIERGTAILAALDGTVEKADFDAEYGKYVLLDHGNGLETLYAHCQSLSVEAGDTVEQGDVIAAVGSTGMSTGPHLHFEVRQDGEPQDPLGYHTGETLEQLELPASQR